VVVEARNRRGLASRLRTRRVRGGIDAETGVYRLRSLGPSQHPGLGGASGRGRQGPLAGGPGGGGGAPPGGGRGAPVVAGVPACPEAVKRAYVSMLPTRRFCLGEGRSAWGEDPIATATGSRRSWPARRPWSPCRRRGRGAPAWGRWRSPQTRRGLGGAASR